MSFPSKQTLRSSGLLFSLLFAVIFGIIPHIIHNEPRLYIYIFSVVVIFLSFFSPYSLRTPYSIWLKLGSILGRVNTTLVLSIFFYLIITPSALLRRSFRYIIKRQYKVEGSYYNKSQLSTTINFKDQI